MANTTFSGPVRSENGFESITKNATTGAITSNATYGKSIIASVQALAGAGAADVTNLVTEVTAAGTGDVVTLANGTAGQMKIVSMVGEAAGTDTVVLTPATFAGGTTITFDTVGESATLIYNATIGWVLVSNNGGTVA
jgi:hypothetical protein